jgi:hypothetical protein
MQEQYDFDFFSIIDIDDKSNPFLGQQNIIKFNKIWNFREYVLKPQKIIDRNYLRSFEKKYGINLLSIVYRDGIFYQFNDYYRFTSDEVLSIVEQTCKFFENVLDEVKPHFLMMRNTTDLNSELLYWMCKAKGIRILNMSASRIGYRNYISETTDFLDEPFILEKYSSTDDKTFYELQAYVKKYPENVRKYAHKLKFSTWKRLIAGLKFLIFYYDSNYRSYYRNFGRSRFKILVKEGSLSLKRRYRESFLNKHSLYHLDDITPFIFFPLHFEPERAISVAAPFYTNQVEVITSIAKSLPVEYLLYVKEHPAQQMTSWKSIWFYKKILELPNVRLIHHSVYGEELLKKCSLVITIAGTAGIEAAFYDKPAIVLTDTLYSTLSFIHRLKSIEDLPIVIRIALQKKVDLHELNGFVQFMFENSFEYDESFFTTESYDRFQYGGFPMLDISVDKIKSYIEEYKDVFEMLVSEYIKKINWWKEHDSNTK